MTAAKETAHDVVKARAALAVAKAVEHGCAVVGRQLDARCWGWASSAAAIVDNLAATLVRLTASPR